jgi:hypothetical protein
MRAVSYAARGMNVKGRNAKTELARLARALVIGCVCALGCEGRLPQLQAYEQEMCACEDEACVQAVDAKYADSLSRPESWVERKFLKSETRQAEIAAVEHATECAERRRTPMYLCGGTAATECPPGYHCEVGPEAGADRQGLCVAIATSGSAATSTSASASASAPPSP